MNASEDSDPTDDGPARSLAIRQFCLIYGLAAEIATAQAEARSESEEDENAATLFPVLDAK